MKKIYKNSNRKNGFSMIEILIVTAILGILMMMAITMLPRQLEKARDSKRKSDLQKIKISFEHYYNDKGCYPSSSVLSDYCDGIATQDHELSSYLPVIPCDPKDGSTYLYAPYDKTGGVETCDGYRVWTNLEKNDDLDIANLNCDGENGCGAYEFFGEAPENMGAEALEYNYGVSEGVAVSTDVLGSEGTGEGGGVQVCCNGVGTTCQVYGGGENEPCDEGPYNSSEDCYNLSACERQ